MIFHGQSGSNSKMLSKDKGADIRPEDVPFIVRGELGYEEYLDQHLM